MMGEHNDTFDAESLTQAYRDVTATAVRAIGELISRAVSDGNTRAAELLKDQLGLLINLSNNAGASLANVQRATGVQVARAYDGY